jgi:CRP-like cAMP-binding protein
VSEPRNRLLAALPPADFQAFASHLERVELGQRDALFEPEVPIPFVYFPETAVVSLTSFLHDGGSVEIGTAGREGMAGLSIFLGERSGTVRAITQIPGTAVRMKADVFARVAAASGPLHALLLRYTHAFLSQVAQTAACNGAHLVAQRCARWLLMTHDRVERDDFPLTHELLAFMLGVRSAGVTLAMVGLQDAGLVHYMRGRVTMDDRVGLERVSCECYGVVHAQYERLFGRPPASS